MRIPFFLALIAFLGSLAVNAWLFIESTERQESLQDQLRQTERQSEDLKRQLDGLEKDRRALDSFRAQQDVFFEALNNLESSVAQLNGIRSSMETVSTNEMGEQWGLIPPSWRETAAPARTRKGPTEVFAGQNVQKRVESVKVVYQNRVKPILMDTKFKCRRFWY